MAGATSQSIDSAAGAVMIANHGEQKMRERSCIVATWRRNVISVFSVQFLRLYGRLDRSEGIE